MDYGEGAAEGVARGYDSYLAVGMDVPYGLPREGKAVPYQCRRQEDPGSELHRHLKDVP